MTSATWTPRSADAEHDEIGGQLAVRSYGDAGTEYASLREGAMLVDRSHRQRVTFTGARAADVLTGMVTNDVLALGEGQGCYAAALTPKGRIVADVRVLSLAPERLLVEASARAAHGWFEMVRKYVNPRLAGYADISAETRQIGLYGAHAARITAAITGIDPDVLAALPPYAHVPLPGGDAWPALVTRVPDLRLDGFEIVGTEPALLQLWTEALDAGATATGLDAYDIARIEAGRPEWGIDMDDTTIPQEANLDELHAISYTKGCYTGQEVVARVHFRGHVNRHLRGLRSEQPLPAGAELLDATGKVVGDVRSTVRSPRLGYIALGMVRREVEMGSTVVVRAPDASAPATVLALPFPS